MAKVNLVSKQVRMDIDDIIKFQFITHCYINRITLSELDLECLVYLAHYGEIDLVDFCNTMAERRLEKRLEQSKKKSSKKIIEASPQTIRNILSKIEKQNLLIREGRGRKKIKLNPDLKIQSQGNILLNYKLVYIDTKES